MIELLSRSPEARGIYIYIYILSIENISRCLIGLELSVKSLYLLGSCPI